jgi:hypothetical protein
MKALILFLVYFFISQGSWANAYIIIYATHNGHTGHCGIAVDDYYIRVNEPTSDRGIYTFDSIKTGSLVYYDLWPYKDEYKGNYEGDVTPRYYKLPSATYKQLISLRTLTDQGLPHKLNEPCDAILSYPCSTKADFLLKNSLAALVSRDKPFNAMHYNCGDFVLEAIRTITNQNYYAKEFVIKDFVTTPNEIFKVLSKEKNFRVIKDPGDRIQGTFVQERILERVLPVMHFFQLFTLIPSLL